MVRAKSCEINHDLNTLAGAVKFEYIAFMEKIKPAQDASPCPNRVAPGQNRKVWSQSDGNLGQMNDLFYDPEARHNY